MSSVRIAASASAYLRREAAYLRRHSPAAGEAFLMRLREARRRLAQFPKLGPPEDEDVPEGRRRLVVADYILQYVLVGNEVWILSARHGRQQRTDPGKLPS